MPKFQRVCNNPLHEKWSKNGSERIISLRSRGLWGLSKVWEQFLNAKLGQKPSHKVKHLCTKCLKECFRKRKFTKLIPKNDADEIKKRVDQQVD